MFVIDIVTLGVLEVVKKNIDDSDDVLHMIGAYLKSQSDQRFTEQGRPSGAWDKPMTPDIPGIIQDVNRGAPPRARRFDENRPALESSGRLKQYTVYDLEGKNRVKIGTNLSYGPVQQHGGKSETEKMKKKGQEVLWAFLQGKGGAHAGDLAFLLNKKYLSEGVTIMVRSRPFVDMDDSELDELTDLVLEGLQKL